MASPLSSSLSPPRDLTLLKHHLRLPTSDFHNRPSQLNPSPPINRTHHSPQPQPVPSRSTTGKMGRNDKTGHAVRSLVADHAFVRRRVYKPALWHVLQVRASSKTATRELASLLGFNLMLLLTINCQVSAFNLLRVQGPSVCQLTSTPLI